jgi:hypothetical protein
MFHLHRAQAKDQLLRNQNLQSQHSRRLQHSHPLQKIRVPLNLQVVEITKPLHPRHLLHSSLPLTLAGCHLQRAAMSKERASAYLHRKIMATGSGGLTFTPGQVAGHLGQT